jgi:hypothetical protein
MQLFGRSFVRWYKLKTANCLATEKISFKTQAPTVIALFSWRKNIQTPETLLKTGL